MTKVNLVDKAISIMGSISFSGQARLALSESRHTW